MIIEKLRDKTGGVAIEKCVGLKPSNKHKKAKDMNVVAK